MTQVVVSGCKSCLVKEGLVKVYEPQGLFFIEVRSMKQGITLAEILAPTLQLSGYVNAYNGKRIKTFRGSNCPKGKEFIVIGDYIFSGLAPEDILKITEIVQCLNS